MSLINRTAVKRAALDLASSKFKERNKTRLEMGLEPIKNCPTRVSGEFIETFEARAITMLGMMVADHKKGVTL